MNILQISEELQQAGLSKKISSIIIDKFRIINDNQKKFITKKYAQENLATKLDLEKLKSSLMAFMVGCTGVMIAAMSLLATFVIQLVK